MESSFKNNIPNNTLQWFQIASKVPSNTIYHIQIHGQKIQVPPFLPHPIATEIPSKMLKYHQVPVVSCTTTHSANGPWKKSLNFIFPTKYVTAKSLKFSHWLSETKNISHNPRISNIFPSAPEHQYLDLVPTCNPIALVNSTFLWQENPVHIQNHGNP